MTLIRGFLYDLSDLDVCGLLGFPSCEFRPAVISRIGFKPEITVKTLIRAETSTPEQLREEMIKYYAAHPKSPTATRRPQLSFRNKLWIAFLGSSVTDGIVGVGSTVEEALRSFDNRYALERVQWDIRSTAGR